MSHPSHIGRYQILGVLGVGGMAEILLGRQSGPSGFERPVVIKRILPHLARQDNFVAMFLDEARIVAGIRHTNVVHVQDLSKDGDELFMVMEYLEGESLAGIGRRLATQRKLPRFDLCTHIMGEVCAGLHAAHELKDPEGNPQGLVHRDVSPHNIFVTYSGEVKLLDFGVAMAADRIAKTEAGQIKGKHAYMSPEQCLGKGMDRRSDIFSLGIVLYELSTSRRLFKRANDLLTLRAICEDEISPPSRFVSDYPTELDEICIRALRRDPNTRYPTALAMQRDLISLTRKLAPQRVLEESLSKMMHSLFADRIEEKRAMLNRLRRGDEVTSIPQAETDESVEIPTTIEPSESKAVAMAPSLGTTAPLEPKQAWALRMMIGSLVLLGGAILFSALYTPSNAMILPAPSIPGPQIEPVPSPAVPPDPAPVVAAPVPVAVPAQEVNIEVHTSPDDANVFVDGVHRGNTPLSLGFPRGEEAKAITVKLRGFNDVTENVLLDVDQRLRITLESKQKPHAKKPQPTMRTPVKKEPLYKRFE